MNYLGKFSVRDVIIMFSVLSVTLSLLKRPAVNGETVKIRQEFKLDSNMEFVGRHSQIYGNYNVPIHVFTRLPNQRM